MVIKEELFTNLNEGIIEERYRTFLRNLKNNIPLIEKNGGLQKDINDLSEKHIVVIGAGPSLEKNIPFLKKLNQREDVRFIVADMALRPLFFYGVLPHYVISCETTPSNFLNCCDSSSMHLLAFSCVSNGNIRNWKGKMSFYNWMIDEEPYPSLWEMIGEDIGRVATASIVTTQAISIALGVNPKSIILVGNDLAFTNSYYCRETVYFEKRINQCNRFDTYFSLDKNATRLYRDYKINRGDEIFYTNHQFLSAKMWLEDLFEKTAVPVYDLSIPGCSEKFVIKKNEKNIMFLFQRSRNHRRKK